MAKRALNIIAALFLTASFIVLAGACGRADGAEGGVTAEKADSGEAQNPPVEPDSTGTPDSTGAPLPEENQPSSFRGYPAPSGEQGAIGYWLYTPENPVDGMPLIVYLHGASGRGESFNGFMP